MKRSTQVLVLAFSLVVFQVGFAASAEDGERKVSTKHREAVYLLETWLESVIDFDRLPGISIAIVYDQEIVYAKGFGYMDVEKRVKATPGTIYSICSISKLFTSIALMQLRDAGKLSLDDAVSKHLPWFAPGMVNPDARPPTLRDLLRHSGGLPAEPDHTVWSEPDLAFPSRDGLIERVSSLKMSYPTNADFNYSNLGYSLLGEVVSVVSGMEYSDYLQQNILEPLGLEATTPYLPTDLLGSKMAIGYGRWPRAGSRVKITSCDARALTPAGGLASTVEDLAEFAMWQFRVLDGKDDALLSQQTLMEMQTVQWSDPEWGLGFSIWHMGNSRFVGHQGGCPGYKSQIILDPEQKIAVVVMVNATDAPQFTLVFRAYEIMAAALTAPMTKVEGLREWAEYTGYYTADKSWSEVELLEWDGSLSVMWIPTPDPLGSLEKLKRVEGNVFRRVKSDGKLGKHYVFKTDAAGNSISMKFNNNLLKKTVR
jgi:CubicO group peptidase (beta-lactamase class C family)